VDRGDQSSDTFSAGDLEREKDLCWVIAPSRLCREH
jgi:hypothetical protein